MRVLRVATTAVLVGIAVVGAAIVRSTPAPIPVEDEVLARVNGDPITRRQFDEYASVLEGHGVRVVPAWQVMQSLVNQRLALEEARRRGYKVEDDELDRSVTGLAGDGVTVDMVGDLGGFVAFRERLRTRLLFEKVKAAVTDSIRVTERDIRAYLFRYAALYQEVGFQIARAEVEPAVRQGLVDAYWSDWLDVRRACADIQILLPINQPRSSSPSAGCP